MGMDVFGKRPTAEVGEYFRNSVWWWHPLADWLVGQFPMLTRKCRYWHSNDGDGLNARQSLKLAEALQGALQEGRVLRYAQERVATLELLPDEICGLCEGSGSRTDEIGRAHGFDSPGECNGCGGTGRVRPWETWYEFSEDNVKDFTQFLNHCGGFRIC